MANGELTVQLQPAPDRSVGSFIDEAGTEIKFESAVTIHYGTAKDGCHDKRSVIRLPVFGPAMLGNDFSAQMNLDDSVTVMRSGHIDSYSRITPTFLSSLLSNLGSNALDRSALFPAGSIAIPAGSRVRECAPQANLVPWSGYAEARMDGTDVNDRALDVVLYTAAKRISFTSPSGEKSGGVNCDAPGDIKANLVTREDVVAVSLLARLVGDPNIAAETLVIGFLMLLAQITISLIELKRSKQGDAHR